MARWLKRLWILYFNECMHTVNLLTNVVENHAVLAYIIIFFGLVFEGELILISTGILAHLGAFNFWFALFFVLLGGFSKTLIGYSLGKYLYNKFNHNRFFKYVEKRVNHYMPHFKAKPFWSIFISKFIIGANHLVILFSGFERINYKKFLKAEIISTLIWAPLLLSIGYIFSQTALYITNEIWRFSMIVLVLIAIFIIFDKLIGWLYEIFEEFYHDHSSPL